MNDEEYQKKAGGVNWTMPGSDRNSYIVELIRGKTGLSLKASQWFLDRMLDNKAVLPALEIRKELKQYFDHTLKDIGFQELEFVWKE